MGLTFDGIDEFRASFQRLRDRSRDELDSTVKRHMEDDVLPKTQERVPVATGRLKETGRVEPGSKAGAYAVWYGDSAVNNDSMVDYAAAVHEIEHARHDPPTQAKFVEEPLKESVPRLKQKAGDALERVARG